MSEAIPESPEEKEARLFFEESLGLRVTRVPGAPTKTADFLIDGDDPGYALEVKTRFDDENFLKELESGITTVRSRSLGYDRWGIDTAREARKQLSCVDPSHGRYWLLWFSINCLSSAEDMFGQAMGTIYGIRQVVYWDEATERTHGRDCLFVIPGVFERWQDIDGTIVTMGDAITLCINEFSNRAKPFQLSRLYQSFARIGVPVSPSDLEANRGFLSITDSTLDRRNEAAVSQYLSQKYNLSHMSVLDMKVHSASAVVRRT
jgi:hypothetical protein